VIFTHPICLEHDPGAGHPECPQRLQAVLAALSDPHFDNIPRRDAPVATRAQLAAVHAQDLLELIFAHAPHEGRIRLDADTAMSPASLEAALRAAGAICAAVDAVMQSESRRAFCAVRPPGHHATRDTAMGFCVFNSVAVGARHALDAHGVKRLAVVDFDVHHGNGTQDVFWDDPRVFYLSSHQAPLYPGTGRTDERGSAHNVLNVPLPPGAGSAEFRAAYTQHVLPALDRFAPELLLISAGFDAHRLDPLANLNLDTEDYAWVTGALAAVANRHAKGRMISALEGGYSLTALRESTRAHCASLFDLG
jgi:acetoin utilization deacetylase AcuC-like enzyme